MLSSGAFLTNTWGDSDLLPACLDQLRDRGAGHTRRGSSCQGPLKSIRKRVS